jgi:hypothetical protein
MDESKAVKMDVSSAALMAVSMVASTDPEMAV